jgi:hypothetical protein
MSELTELYFSKVNSSLSPEKIEQELEWLTSQGWSHELLYFSINYGAKFLIRGMERSIKQTLVAYEKEIVANYEIATAKRHRSIKRGSEPAYDPKNELKGANTPTWFGKSIDFSLFE